MSAIISITRVGSLTLFMKQELDVRLNLKLHPRQQEVHEGSNSRFKVIKAGKRFGKSYWAGFELVQMAFRKPGGVFWFLSPTYGQAKEIMWDFLKRIIPPQLITSVLNTDLEINLCNGSKIKLKGADNETSLRGIALDGVIFDEAAYIDGYAWTLIRGQLAASLGPAYFISSPNKHGRNWYSSFCQQAFDLQRKGDPNWAYWHFSIHDNPLLPKDEIDAMRQSMTDDTWNLEYMALESEFSGILVGEFEYNRHVVAKDTPERGFWVRGIDWGIAHPTTCLWLHVDMDKKQVYVADEFYKSGNVIQESCKSITQITQGRQIAWTVIDPSTAKRNSQTGRSDKDEFMRNGIYCVPGDNKDRGIDIMKMFFKRDMITIHPKCKNLISELKNYQRGDKEGDDCLDPLRYALVRIHDLVYGGNLWPESPSAEKALPPYTLSLNSPMFKGAKNPLDMSWANAEIQEITSF